jgi:carbon monoxide dehydrogenase subunit G
MPEITKTFTVDAPAQESWEYLTDMENFASHLPGFEEFEEEDAVTSYWTIKVDLSMFTKELTFEVQVLEEEYPRAAFTLEPVNQPATGSGAVTFDTPEEQGGTAMTLQVESEAEGRMAPFLNKVIDKALHKVSEEFVENLEAAPITDDGASATA